MTTPEQARGIAAHMMQTSPLYVAYMSLADQVEALTKERDEYAKAADTQAAAHKVERDKHCNCEFEGDENTVQCTLHNAWAETLHEQAGFRRERDALAAAGRLAMDVCVDLSGVRMNQMEYLSVLRAIAALKAAGVQ